MTLSERYEAIRRERRKQIIQLKNDEGFREKPYTCPAGKLTIGYGFNIEDEGLLEEVADFWLERLVWKVEREIMGREELGDWSMDSASPRWGVLVNMGYNLGVPRLMGFKKMWAAIKAEDWETAANEMLDSKWSRQVGKRAERLAEQMRTGEWQS